MRVLNLKRHERGDTMVEVLISIAVVSSVLALTYSTMNRNLLTTRASQERTEATKYAQSQLEALKVYTDTTPTIPAGSFCMGAGGARTNLGGTPNTDASLDNFGIYVGCTQGFYHMGIVPQGSRLYRIYVRWERIGGGGVQEVAMSYKVAN